MLSLTLISDEVQSMIASGEAREAVFPPRLHFPGYWVTRGGKVWSAKLGRWLTETTEDTGRVLFQLSLKDSNHKVLRAHLVKLLFDGNPPSDLIRPVLRHYNDVVNDDRLENLVWGTQKQNSEDMVRNGHAVVKRGVESHLSKYTESQVKSVLSKLALGKSVAQVARETGVGYHSVWRLQKGLDWKHLQEEKK